MDKYEIAFGFHTGKFNVFRKTELSGYVFIKSFTTQSEAKDFIKEQECNLTTRSSS